MKKCGLRQISSRFGNSTDNKNVGTPEQPGIDGPVIFLRILSAGYNTREGIETMQWFNAHHCTHSSARSCYILSVKRSLRREY